MVTRRRWGKEADVRCGANDDRDTQRKGAMSEHRRCPLCELSIRPEQRISLPRYHAASSNFREPGLMARVNSVWRITRCGVGAHVQKPFPPISGCSAQTYSARSGRSPAISGRAIDGSG